MKKVFFVLMMAATVLVFSCKKANDSKNPATDPSKDAPETPSDDPAKPEDKAKPVEITLDGNAEEWAAITEASVKDNEFIGIAKGEPDETGQEPAIRIAKTTSDADNIYIYLEIMKDALPQNSICSEWGDSYSGTPELGYKGDEENDSFREVMHLFIDPDGDPNTGFFTYAGKDGETPAIPGLGCEMCSQFFCFYNPETNKFGVAWIQTNIGPTKIADLNEDGSWTEKDDYDYTGTIFQSWPDGDTDAAIPRWGWQNEYNDGKGDNMAPRPENLFQGDLDDHLFLEFAIEKSDITNLPDDATEFAWGIQFIYGDYNQAIGPLSATYAK